MSGLVRLKTDLMCAYGFSKKNAEEAITLFLQEKLSPVEEKAFNNILETDPFKLQDKPPHRLEHITWNWITVLNKLNHRITTNGS